MAINLTSFSDTPEFQELLRILLTTAVNKAEIPAITLSDLISNMYNSGMSKDAIRAQLVGDLRDGGPIFGEFRKAFVSTFQQNIERSSQLVTNAIYRSELPREEPYSWVTTKANNCDDCLERESRPAQTLEEWELEGIPQSGVTLCGLYCGCKLVPDRAKEQSVDQREPISATE